MNKVVFTLSLGQNFKKLGEVTYPTIKAYAEKVGADFVVLDENNFSSNLDRPHWCKLQAFRNLLEEYDKVLYVDTDIVIRDDAPDLFEIVGNKLGVFNEGQFTDRKMFVQYLAAVQHPNVQTWKGEYYNTGVILANKTHKLLFTEPPTYLEQFYEQSYINAQIEFLKPKVHNLHYRFNRMSCMDQITGEERYDSYFMHYAGLSGALGVDELCNLIKSDLAVWADTPERKYKKHIAVMVEGGLGDQISAEPTVRYIKEVIYKGDDVIVVSDWPELFEHLNIPAYKPTDKVKNHMAYRKLHTLRSPEHESWDYMSHPLVHCVNFASLQALRCELPTEYKQPQLSVNSEALESVKQKVGDVSNSVIVHPGKGWASKTFPKDVWQSYVDGLIEVGKKVIVVGKRISEEQGVVEINTSKCVDMIDKLSVKELIALISISPVVITNDSSPVHIAGAFDNYIGLIATCKSPEYILHYRKGSQSYKTKSLEVDKLWNDYNQQPTQVYGEKIDKVTDERLRQCLPSKEQVVNFVMSME